MPNTYTTLGSLFTAIANAIRAKTGSSAAIVADDFPTEIANIPSGGGTLITKSITSNGTYNAQDDNADGYSSVTVNVPTSGKVIPDIPSDYTKVDYIEGTGTQYFDAGLITGGNNQNLTVYIDFEITTSFANNYLIGSYNGSAYFYMRSSGSDVLQIRDSSARDIKNIGKNRTKFQTSFSGPVPIYINDDIVSFVAYGASVAYNQNLSFFDMYNSRQGTKGKYKLYYAEIIHGKNLGAGNYTPMIYRYVPCIRNADSKPGVYCVGTNTYNGFIPSASGTDFVVPT